MIKLPIEIGDILLVGRFKNKRIKVKEIGTDEHGLPTVNGRGILKIRIEKIMKTKKNLKEDHTNRPGKHFKNIRNLDYDVDTQDGVKIAKFIDKGKQYHYNVDNITSIRRLKPNTISIGGEYVDNRKFYKEFTIQELEKILDKKLKFVNFDREIKENKNMKTKKNLKESFSNELENLKDQFEKLKYYTKINSDGSISAYYNKFNPDRLTISVSDHPDHPAGRFYLYILYKVEVNSRSLADPTAAYQTTSARIVKHSTKKIRKYYDDFAKVIASINKVLSANNFTLLNYSDIKESKQFKLANIAKKILKEIKIYNSIDEVEEFLLNYQPEILASITGESDGWNQKIDAIYKILKREKLDFSEDIWNSEEFEELINSL